MKAQIARGADFESGNLIKKAKSIARSLARRNADMNSGTKSGTRLFAFFIRFPLYENEAACISEKR